MDNDERVSQQVMIMFRHEVIDMEETRGGAWLLDSVMREHLIDSLAAQTKAEESSDPILVSVNVLGSPGPLRIVVDKNDSVQETVDFALRRYTAQKRLPALVEPTACFGLYCRNPDFEGILAEPCFFTNMECCAQVW